MNNQTRPLILLEADRTLKFGSMLPDERRAWMMGVLRHHLIVGRNGNQGTRRVAMVGRR